MNSKGFWAEIGTIALSALLGLIKPKRQRIDPKILEALAQEATPTEKISTSSSTPPVPLQALEFARASERELGGDYCPYCPSNKHLLGAKDALRDAYNIVNREGKFTEVAEDKIQNAVEELRGAEKDLEIAVISPEVKPVADELHTQIGKLRNFLRADRSGLEIATVGVREFDEMKKALETALDVVSQTAKKAYELSKLETKERIRIMRQEER